MIFWEAVSFICECKKVKLLEFDPIDMLHFLAYIFLHVISLQIF
jgi:hypothetical protein